MAKKAKLVELIPRERLSRYLETVAHSSGMALRLLDTEGEPLVEAAGGDARCPDDAGWSAVAGALGPGIGSVEQGGLAFISSPVNYRGERLGYLAACVESGSDGAGRGQDLVALCASHIEGLAESGYEVESLSAEVVRVYEELALIYGLTAKLGARVEVADICEALAEEAQKVLDATDVTVMLSDEKDQVMRPQYAVGEHGVESMHFTPGFEEGLVGRAYVGHRSVLVCEADKDRRHTGWPYEVRRFLAVPMMADGKVNGMIVATDRRDGGEFDSRQEKLLSAMASVAAIAIKNAQLYTEIRDLLEGFINASVTAVESRDPTTAGHSSRVAVLTVELARKVSESDLPAFKGASFGREQLMELRYAGLLHDFGKIGVKESVLLKESKLSPERIGDIRARFAYIRERRLRESLEAKLALLLTKGEAAYKAGLHDIESSLAVELGRLEEYLGVIEMANDPRVLVTELPELRRLSGLTGLRYPAPEGGEAPYMTEFEFSCLNILKGSLNEEERREIESHVSHSYNFLSRIPWTRSFAGVPGIVHAHHEKLDGSGYPKGLKAPEIPLQSRIMTVADIYDALTAWDRPYKDAVSAQKALFILDMEAGEGKLDPYLVQIFRDAGVYRAVEHMLPRRRA